MWQRMTPACLEDRQCLKENTKRPCLHIPSLWIVIFFRLLQITSTCFKDRWCLNKKCHEKAAIMFTSSPHGCKKYRYQKHYMSHSFYTHFHKTFHNLVHVQWWYYTPLASLTWNECWDCTAFDNSIGCISLLAKESSTNFQKHNEDIL